MNDSAVPLQPLTQIPADIVSLSDYERYAREMLPAPVFAHVAGGSADEFTLRRASAQFAQYEILPRPLRDVSAGTTATTILGAALRHPIALAPVAYQKLVHADGEQACAQAAEALDAPLVLSTLSSVALEDIADTTSGALWLQLYFQAQREHTLDLVRRAERSGYSALVVTIDAPVQALQNRAERNGFSMPPNVVAANLLGQLSAVPGVSAQQSRVFQGVMRTAPTWQDIEWLRSQTSLPILIKGVLHPDDTHSAIQLGADGIVVSNHGGRALDRAPTALSMLPSIRERVGPDVPVLIDGGVRRGADIFIALALGADAVLIGRPQVYALAVAGSLGVAHMLRVLRDELEVTMALAGCATIGDIDTDCITRRSHHEDPASW